MSTLTHKEGARETTTIRVSRDLWEVARQKAFDRRIPIQEVFDEVLRAAWIKPQASKRSA